MSFNKKAQDDQDVEGHGWTNARDATLKDASLKASPDEDDTEGHGSPKIAARDASLKSTPDDDDTEGHSQLK